MQHPEPEAEQLPAEAAPADAAVGADRELPAPTAAGEADQPEDFGRPDPAWGHTWTHGHLSASPAAARQPAPSPPTPGSSAQAGGEAPAAVDEAERSDVAMAEAPQLADVAEQAPPDAPDQAQADQPMADAAERGTRPAAGPGDSGAAEADQHTADSGVDAMPAAEARHSASEPGSGQVQPYHTLL